MVLELVDTLTTSHPAASRVMVNALLFVPFPSTTTTPGFNTALFSTIRERDTERERKRERWLETYTHKNTNIQTDIDRPTDKHTHTHTHR